MAQEQPEQPTLAPPPPRQGLSPWVVLSLIAALGICCCFVAFFVLPAVLSLSGVDLGDVYSNIIRGAGTPGP